MAHRFWTQRSLGVLRISGWEVVTIGKRLDYDNLTQFEDIGVVVAFVGGIAATEDEHFVFVNLAGGVECASERYISSALFEGPLNCLVVHDSQSVEVVFGQEIFGIVEFFGLLQSSEQIVRLADSDNCMSRAWGRHGTCLFDLLPGYGSGLNRSRGYHSNGKIKINDKQ